MAPLLGNESANIPWEEWQSFKDQENISVGKQEFLSVEKVVYFPWWFHWIFFSKLKESFWLQEDTREVTLIPKSWKVLKTQKIYSREKIKISLVFLCLVHHHLKILILIQNGKLMLGKVCWGPNPSLNLRILSSILKG